MDQIADIFPWNAALETGIPEIDEQHIKLVQLLNKLTAHLVNFSDMTIIHSALNELTEYTLYHFQSEEEIWNKYFIDTPDEIAEHKKTHDSFIIKVQELKAKEATIPMEQVLEEIVKFLLNWLAFHILASDKWDAKVVLAIQKGMTVDEARVQANREMNSATMTLVESILAMYGKLSAHTIQLMREISLRKKIEKEKAELQEQLLRSSKLEALTILISGIAHEINNPLASALGNLKLLKRKCVEHGGSEDLSALIRKQEEAIKRVADIIKTLKQITEPVNEHSERLDIHQVINDVIKNYQSESKDQKFKIEVDLKAENPHFLGNLNKMDQIILNLISNARDACADLNDGKVILETINRDNLIILNVTDNGIGIDEDTLKKVLTPYFTTKAPGQGTGLGLCVSNSHIETMGGNLTIKSELGVGTSFSISFPIN